MYVCVFLFSLEQKGKYKMTKNLWIFIFLIHLSIGQSNGDLAPRDLEFDNVTPEKNVIKTWGTIFPG